jgi:hypothetical protein
MFQMDSGKMKRTTGMGVAVSMLKHEEGDMEKADDEKTKQLPIGVSRELLQWSQGH